MNKTAVWAILAVMTLGLVSCGSDPANTGIEYAPEMYHTIALEPYTQISGEYAPFKDSMNAQLPPEGVITYMGKPAYDLGNNDSDRVVSNSRTVNPIPATAANLAMGDTLYRRYCGVCHGKDLKGGGPVDKNSDAINPPNLMSGDQLNFSAGRLYFTIMHGKNMMGSYASQIPGDDRWKVVHHIQKLQHPERYQNLGPDGMVAAAPAPADTAAAAHGGRNR